MSQSFSRDRPQDPLTEIRKTNSRFLRILSIDGGGIRGLSALYILDAIMQQVQAIMNIPEDVILCPCDFFDLICGSSTGGWIAIMLGRLRMSVRECIEAYVRIAEVVFANKK
ncbi:FabD/lysophospholipase-like protein, partial [Atractiella rhizophila]